MNSEFQRIGTGDQKAFLSDQCKQIEGKNRIGKTRDVFKKIRDTKGIFYAKMATIKDGSSMDITETEDIKKRWQEYTDQIRSVAQSCATLCNPMNCTQHGTPGLPVHHQLREFTQTHIHRVSDAIQPSHPLSSPSPLAPNPSQHQSLFQSVNSSHEVAKLLEFQL